MNILVSKISQYFGLQNGLSFQPLDKKSSDFASGLAPTPGHPGYKDIVIKPFCKKLRPFFDPKI